MSIFMKRAFLYLSKKNNESALLEKGTDLARLKGIRAVTFETDELNLILLSETPYNKGSSVYSCYSYYVSGLSSQINPEKPILAFYTDSKGVFYSVAFDENVQNEEFPRSVILPLSLDNDNLPYKSEQALRLKISERHSLPIVNLDSGITWLLTPFFTANQLITK